MSYYGYPQRKRRPTVRKKLGQGYRSNFRGRGMKYYQPQRSFVPRTMGPFAQTESKYFDSFLAATNIQESTDWTGCELNPATLNTLVVPQEGSDINNRIGRKIAIYRLSIRGVIRCAPSPDQADVLSPPAIRLILFIDEQTNGTQVQAETLMAAPGSATVPLCFNTFQNLANLGRFRVLKDKTYRSGVIGVGTDGASTMSQNLPDIPFKWNIRFRKPVVINFNSTNGGTVGDIVDNSFHLIGTKSGTDFTHSIAYECRTAYKDH